MLQATYDAPRVFFYVVRSVIPQWWAGRGHRKVLAACNAGSSNPVQSTTMRLEPLVVGFKPVTGGCHYGYYPNPNSPVTHRSVQRRHGFHRPYDYCDRFAEILIESDDPTLRLALCGRLTACLALLRPTLNDPIPLHLDQKPDR